MELLGLRKDGSQFPVEVNLSPLQTSGGALACAIIRDVSQQRALARERKDAAVLGERQRMAVRSIEKGKPWVRKRSLALSAKLETARFTQREMEIIQLMAAGKSNKEIGAQLNTAASTVKIHLSHIFRKLGARNRTEAIRLVLENGIVRPQPRQAT